MRRNDLRGAARRAVAACGSAALAALAAPSPASAYCRTSVCTGVGTAAVCTPAQQSDCGIPLFWSSPCMSYSIQKDASSGVSLAETEAVFAAAFDTWMNADCDGGQKPRLLVEYTGPIECGKHEYNQKKHNANVIAFREDSWPYPGSGNTLALTTVTYNLDTGEIYDADMELNAFDTRFSVGDAAVTFDLLSIATHEAGHFLGLSHSRDYDATMFTDYRPGSVNLRDLNDDDRAGICAVYPPGAPVTGCDSTPRHGFSSLCAADQSVEEPSDGCSIAAPGGGDGARRSQTHVGTYALAALAVLGAAARRATARGAPTRRAACTARKAAASRAS
jgi:hypothetical protein